MLFLVINWIEHFLKVALEKEMEVHRESQQKQIAKLRDEIQENETLIAELKE